LYSVVDLIRKIHFEVQSFLRYTAVFSNRYRHRFDYTAVYPRRLHTYRRENLKSLKIHFKVDAKQLRASLAVRSRHV
jgi:hypothetical protein